MIDFRRLRKPLLPIIAAGVASLAMLLPVSGLHGSASAEEGQKLGRVTGLPLPRFVSLKSRTVNLRVGPGRKYPISWRYTKPGLPVEIIQEFDRWRRIRDADGTQGWVLHSLLTGRRTAIVAPWDAKAEAGTDAPLLEGKASPSSSAAIAVKLQAGLVVNVDACDKTWCAVAAGGARAWLPQQSLWGVYPDETIEG